MRLNLRAHQNGCGVVLNVVPQAFKHGEGFAFVFLFRIFLCIAAQVDALAQVVHGGKVFAPLQVDDLQHDVAFEIRHRFFADQLDFGCVFFFHAFNQTLFDVLIVQSAVCFEPCLDVFVQAEFGGKLAFECGDVPLLFHAVGRYVQIDQIADDFFADTFSQVADVFAVEDFVALVVDDGPLTGLPSTIIDLSSPTPRLLRQGAVTVDIR